MIIASHCFYVQRCRTSYLNPSGITGLAQINQGYDTSIEDVRRKVGFDHSYALSLNSFSNWLQTDIAIIVKTIIVMVDGRGR